MLKKLERIDAMNKNKEELLNELKQLEKDFNTKVADIKKQIEECDKKVFKPNKFGEKYYTIFANGDIFTYNFFNSGIDKEFIDVLKCGSISDLL